MSKVIEKTKSELVKERIATLLRQYIDAAEEEILSGISEGLYSKKDNRDNLKAYEEERKLIDEFLASRPAVFVYVEGGNIQGASGTEDISFDVYDKDNYRVGGDEFIENYGTPEQWDEMITKKTNDGEIKSIF